MNTILENQDKRHSRLAVACMHNIKRVLNQALFLSLILAALCIAADASQYQIENLGSLAGGYTRSRGIGGDGSIVGESVVAGAVQPFIWKNGSMNKLQTFGGTSAKALACNSTGVSAGWAQNLAGKTKPVVWDSQGIHELPTLAGNTGQALAINDSLQTVGYSYYTSNTYHAVLWQDNDLVDLGTLGGNYSVAYGINSTGYIVGSAYDINNKEAACVWINDNPQRLSGITTGTWSSAQAINDAGQIILWGDLFNGKCHAALYDNGQVKDLGTLGGRESWAYGLNNSGVVVGSADLLSGVYHAFVCDGTGISDLGTLGGYYSIAFGINDAGVIAGAAQDINGQWQSVTWTLVPEPSSLIALLSGIMWFTIKRRNSLNR